MKKFTKLHSKLSALITCLCIGLFASAQVTINGTITNRSDVPVENVVVSLIGTFPQEVLTDENGFYEFSVPTGGNYTVVPSYDLFYLNGVDEADVELLSNLILAAEEYESYLQFFAADVISSGIVSTIDLVELMRLVDGTILTFPNNTSWRFFSNDSQYPDPDDPFAEVNILETIELLDLQSDSLGVDFTGVKIGDLNNSAFTVLPIGACNLSCGNVVGNVFYDLDDDCLKDTTDQDLNSWLVEVSDGVTSVFGYTNAMGNYNIPLAPGDYTISVSPPSTNWGLCQSSFPITVIEGEDVIQDFAANAIIECPEMEVSLSTVPLRPCFDRQYFATYCNNGTSAAEDASVVVTFDSLFTINSSSPPWTSQDGNTFTFDIGDVAVNECGTVVFNYLLDCDTEVGQTLCTDAQVFPDSICMPNVAGWDGSNLNLSGECVGDSVVFNITNVGMPMQQMVQYIVIEDDMIMMINGDNDIQLDEGESIQISVPANGSTWRVEVMQTMQNPLAALVSTAVEGCGEDGNGTFSIGFVNLFPQYTAGPTVAEDCEVVVAAFDPNDKAAVPVGVGDEHFIKKNVGLDYKIRFQNTGTDTAFNVIIRDTISPWLDLGSLRPSISSHDYQYNFLGNNVVEFSFQNIMLPDSNVNEPASHGFIKFRINQKTDNPLGTIIENKAEIYFDFEDAIVTNTVFHTIGENFLEVINNVILQPGQQFEIKLSPNPIASSAVLSFEGIDLQEGTFLLYDLYGRSLRQVNFTGNQFTFFKNELTSGMYIFEVLEKGQRLSTGKLMIH